jgi:hypothetical protein
MDVLFRVLVAAFVCVAPTVLFLGLWRGLKRMQNDELVERIADRQGITVEDLLPGAGPRGGSELDADERRTRRRMLADGTASNDEWSDDAT